MRQKYQYRVCERESSTSALATFTSLWEMARFVAYIMKERNSVFVQKVKQ
jgi:hypothetical protein